MAFFMNSFKYTIFLVNLIFFSLGILLFYNTYHQLSGEVFNLSNALHSPIYFTLFISFVIVLISFLGCCGTCNENPCMIKSYAGLILLCVIFQVAAVVMITRIDSNEISKGIKEELIDNFNNQTTTVKRSIQLIQNVHKCCGVFNSSDYNLPDNKLPNSCCGQFDENPKGDPSAVGACAKFEVYKVGCKAKLDDMIKGNSKNIYIILGSVFVFQLLIVCLSCALSKNIREQYNVV